MIKKLLSKVFGFVVDKRNSSFDKKEDIIKCKVPVISVGNLSVGGTGKTPFVQMLTKYFINKGYMTGIVGRGYKRQSKGEVIVSDGRKVLVDAAIGGDEMVLLADSLKVPVIAHDSKSHAALSMQNKFDVDLIIVDDGFQHRNLHRELDIVLIDKETHDNPELMPDGRLREPVESLKRADVVCLTGSFELSEKFKKNIADDAIIIRVKPVKANPYYLEDKSQIKIRHTKKNPLDCIAFAGIAKPDRFFSMVDDLGFKALNNHAFDDHHQYTLKDINLLINLCKKSGCNHLATTEKDAAKLMLFIDKLTDENIKCVVFPIALTITDGKIDFFKLLGRRINKFINKNRYKENEN
ncbi:MAG: tetraacyldisaccharide 4'-kinase [Candidatus Kapabacteria bacterium]|nr:tetraacyldisaccharide 4'-kinase [Ignavibacteriota bacterium]MCW5885490.1 tetraacyldisaccharide 4'-kinase [Candidatus Kapabacteria bacterium]